MANKTLSTKEAIAAYEAKTGLKAAELEKVDLSGSCPPIDKMDAALSTLKACKHLSLSTNNIEKIANLSGLPSLQILSLGRNLLKRFEGLDGVSETLQELWVSYNQIEKVAGLEKLAHLQTLYMSNNKVSSWKEIDALAAMKTIADLVLVGNPIYNDYKDKLSEYRIELVKRMPSLKKLDGMPIELEEREAARA